jgi:ribosomal protein S18 acetylase RimI-like enzyme
LDVVFRNATPADAEQLSDIMAEAFESYRSFAPAGWEPPPRENHVAMFRARLGADDTWCVLAESDGAVAGHVAFMPAAHAVHPIDDPTLCHLFQLFVRPPYQGSGLATELNSRAVDAAGERGYTIMRLFTPAGQARARRFYEREGWVLEREPFYDDALGFEIAEYRRRALSAS